MKTIPPLAFTLLKTCALVAQKAYTTDIQADIVAFRRRQDGLREHIHALNTLSTCPYRARLWIVQELALAKDAVVICGESRLLWDIQTGACERTWAGRSYTGSKVVS